MKRLVAVLVFGLAACGGSTAPGVPDIEGAWVFDYDALAGVVVSEGDTLVVTCSATQLRFSITQVGEGFTGRLTGADPLICRERNGGERVHMVFESMEIVQGEARGNDITFRFDGTSGQHRASVRADGVDGTVSLTFQRRAPSDETIFTVGEEDDMISLEGVFRGRRVVAS